MVSSSITIWRKLKSTIYTKRDSNGFFITSTVLDLTIVGLDTHEPDSSSQAQQPHYLKTCCSPSLELGNIVYLLGYTDQKELIVGEGKVVIATDNLIKLSTDAVTWSPGSAGFDVHGNLAFMVCDPMKLASSPTMRSSSASSSSSHSGKKDLPMQFGIPIPIICDWLYQHWEGNLDELSKPKLPLIRLMSTGQKSDHSCASFTMRRVFKSNEAENEDMPSSSHIILRPRQQLGSICSPNANAGKEQNPFIDLQSTREQGIPTPEIYETRKMVSGPLRKEHSPVQLLDINFPPRAPRTVALPLSIMQLPTEPNKNDIDGPRPAKPSREVEALLEMRPTDPEEYAEGTPPCPAPADCHSEVESSSSPLEVSALPNEGDGFSSEGETMYSAETMESRNYPSPKQHRPQRVGRSQSCMSYNRWGATSRSSAAGKSMLQQQHSLTPVRKTHSQTAATSQKSHDYHTPTVSSIMKKKNGSEPRSRPRLSVVQCSKQIQPENVDLRVLGVMVDQLKGDPDR
ncbi:hypothetical protein Taro_017224 [Colocasia esculenta]|uniref:Uncharacterized protein n=1 Tax=Colocasia esculenta TaxID=4460 RepID=A0A843UQL5_COLES|nr:hypothetical protein [Colocasia esculenta]